MSNTSDPVIDRNYDTLIDTYENVMAFNDSRAAILELPSAEDIELFRRNMK